MSKTSSLSILIVEDNPDHAELLAEIMNVIKVRHTISYAENGLKAMEKLESKKDSVDAGKKFPELIFLDIKMPLMDGITVLKKIRSNPIFDPIQIIMVSTSSIEAEIKSCLQAGANSYLSKPVDSEILKNTLQQLGCEWAV